MVTVLPDLRPARIQSSRAGLVGASTRPPVSVWYKDNSSGVSGSPRAAMAIVRIGRKVSAPTRLPSHSGI